MGCKKWCPFGLRNFQCNNSSLIHINVCYYYAPEALKKLYGGVHGYCSESDATINMQII